MACLRLNTYCVVKVDSDGGGTQERRQKSPLTLDIGFYFHRGNV